MKSLKPVFLRGTRINLNPLDTESDLTQYFEWVNDQDTTQFMEVGNFISTEQSLKEYINHYNNSKNILLGIFLKEGNDHIGNITLHMFDFQNRSAEIGIIIGNREYNGCGYGTEAIRLVLYHAFSRLNLHRVSTGMVDANVASKKAFEKAGFKLEGVMREAFFLDGKYHDAHRYSILREEYQ